MAVSRLLWGALAGLVATGPMTGAMRRMQRHLPPEERYPLPPVEIVDSILAHSGLKTKITPRWEEVLIVLGHYGYGAISGAAYAALTPRKAHWPIARGAGFGLLLWVTSYLGWLPYPAAGHPAPARAQRADAHRPRPVGRRDRRAADASALKGKMIRKSIKRRVIVAV